MAVDPTALVTRLREIVYDSEIDETLEYVISQLEHEFQADLSHLVPFLNDQINMYVEELDQQAEEADHGPPYVKFLGLPLEEEEEEEEAEEEEEKAEEEEAKEEEEDEGTEAESGLSEEECEVAKSAKSRKPAVVAVALNVWYNKLGLRISLLILLLLALLFLAWDIPNGAIPIGAPEVDVTPDLESQILEIMNNSLNPYVFPTEEEFIARGRTDVLKRIVGQRAAWFSSCWDTNTTPSASPSSDSSLPTFSGRIEGEDDAGIEAILTHTSNDVEESTPQNHSRCNSVPWSSIKDRLDDSGEMRMRAGLAERESEAAELSDMVNTNETDLLMTELKYGDEEKGFSQRRSRLKHLELELASVLQNLKNSQETDSLSDAWEFRETEVMKARDKLRSLRAQLAVLEGEMEVEGHKMVEVKQKKINAATRNALSLCRTACIVSPMPASEVLLVGSFDGWTTQRKMERTSSGIFSLYLRLYPGVYEVKFIVDGGWIIDEQQINIS